VLALPGASLIRFPSTESVNVVAAGRYPNVFPIATPENGLMRTGSSPSMLQSGAQHNVYPKVVYEPIPQGQHAPALGGPSILEKAANAVKAQNTAVRTRLDGADPLYKHPKATAQPQTSLISKLQFWKTKKQQ
jgi:hypothetical protein